MQREESKDLTTSYFKFATRELLQGKELHNCFFTQEGRLFVEELLDISSRVQCLSDSLRDMSDVHENTCKQLELFSKETGFMAARWEKLTQLAYSVSETLRKLQERYK